MKTSNKQQVIINYLAQEECRIAILEDGVLEEYYSERTSEHLHVGNIYLGTIQNVEPSIQAAFVDFGIGRNGFLHISDVHPMYFPGVQHEDTESVGRKTPHRERPPIQKCLKSGQKIVVQVIKEGIGTKGPTLTSYPSIPGRYLVMMPNMEHHGVTRKLEDLDARREAKQILNSIDLPKEYGFILRTAGLHRTKAELKRDLAYLTRLWKQIDNKQKHAASGTELYAESDLLMRTVRDAVSPDVERIWIDNPDALQRVEEYLHLLSPRQRKTKLLLHSRPTPVFHDFGVEKQLESMYDREVQLPAGGSIVIDSAEALVAIDVNSGKSRKYRDAETMAYQVNLEAVDEISRQLRLRDLGGLVVLDLIDMRHPKHQRAVETKLKDNLKRDRAKSEMQRISKFGILEMTRQRMRPAVQKTHFSECPNCRGRGFVKTSEASVGDALRYLAFLLHDKRVRKIEMVVSTTAAGALLSNKRKQLAEIEERTGKTVDIRISKAMPVDRIDFYAYDENNADIDLSRMLIEPRDPGTAQPDPMPASTTVQITSQTSDDSSTNDGLQASRSQDKQSNRSSEKTDEEKAANVRTRKRRRRRRNRTEAADSKQTDQNNNATDDSAQEKNNENDNNANHIVKPSSQSPENTNDNQTNGKQPNEKAVEASQTPEVTRKKSRRRRPAGNKRTERSETRPAPDAHNQTKENTPQNTKTPQKPVQPNSSNRPANRRSTNTNIRIFELARELGIKSKELIDFCQKNGIPNIDNHMSCVSQDHAASIRKSLPDSDPAARSNQARTSPNKSDSENKNQLTANTPKKRTFRRKKTSVKIKSKTASVIENTPAHTQSKPTGKTKSAKNAPANSTTADQTDKVTPTTKKRRLYGSRRRLRPAEIAQLSEKQGQ